MHKKLILLIAIILLSGCVKINETSYEGLINEVINSKVKAYNTYRDGYKYYLPKNYYVSNKKGYNEVIQNNNNVYYLYTDVVGYMNEKKEAVKFSKNTYYQTYFGDKNDGLLKITTKNNKYLVEIIYNYAKIEVIVKKDNLNEAITNGLVILSSIKYNKGILKNKSVTNVLNYNEKNVNIFSKKSGTETTSSFLKYVELSSTNLFLTQS